MSTTDGDTGNTENAPPTLRTIFPYTPPPWAGPDVLTNPPLHGRLRLANLPTPLHRVGYHHHDLTFTLTLKRDDATGGVELGGNKLRKLEFLLAEALSRRSDAVVTIGGEQSNHCRATAAAARMLGLEPHLLLRTNRKHSLDRTLTGNLLWDRLVGAKVYTLTPGEYGRFGSEALLSRVCESLRTTGCVHNSIGSHSGSGSGGGSGSAAATDESDTPSSPRRPYSIPVGGSNGLGSWGYLQAVDELWHQYADQNLPLPDHVVFATGSGGTATGIVLGFVLAARYHHRHHHTTTTTTTITIPRLHAVAVCDDEDYFYHKMATVALEMGLVLEEEEEEQPLSPSPNDIDDNDDDSIQKTERWFRRHVTVHQGKGRGYARSTPEELNFCTRFARDTGVVLDPVYTGKALYHFCTKVVPDGSIAADANVLFWHTGGALGMYDRQEVLLGEEDDNTSKEATDESWCLTKLEEVSPVIPLDLYNGS